MALTEQRILKAVTVKPSQSAIEVQWADQILRDGEVISEQYHRKAFGPGQQSEFEAEVEGAAAYVGLVNWGLENETQVTE
jgi:hypothetical protein